MVAGTENTATVAGFEFLRARRVMVVVVGVQVRGQAVVFGLARGFVGVVAAAAEEEPQEAAD